jgi:hypothetical protein
MNDEQRASALIVHRSPFIIRLDEARELECDHRSEQQGGPERDPAQIATHGRVFFGVVDRLRRRAAENTAIRARGWAAIDTPGFADHRRRCAKRDCSARDGRLIRVCSRTLASALGIPLWSRASLLLLLTRGLAPALRA